MSQQTKLAIVGICFVPMVGLFAFAAYAASSPQDLQPVPTDPGDISATAPAPAPVSANLTWAEASPAVLAGIDALETRIDGQSYRAASLQRVRSEEIAKRVGFEGQSPVQALETVLGALDRMAKAYEAMGPGARREVGAMTGLQRVDALLSCSPEEARTAAAVDRLADRYQACVADRECREADEFQANLVRKMLAQKGWFDFYGIRNSLKNKGVATDGVDGTPAEEARFEPRTK